MLNCKGKKKQKMKKVAQFGTVYKRPISRSMIPVTSHKGRIRDYDSGKEMFKSAMSRGDMECFFRLSDQFVTQRDIDQCGQSTMVMVLNTLEIDPGVSWKG